MFGSTDKENETPEKVIHGRSELKYPKPKILLMDMSKDVLDYLKKAGYNALGGTFGSPYEVKISNQFISMIGTPSWPNIAEQEIILIDLTPPPILDAPKGEKATPNEENDIWVKCDTGFIDPRPRFMSIVKKNFERILNHGGVFVIFAKPRLTQNLIFGKIEFDEIFGKEIYLDNWSFLSHFSTNNMEIISDFGEEIYFYSGENSLYRFLHRNLKDARYYAKFNPKYQIKESWIPILKNKYDEDISGLIISGEFKGLILILPQILKKPDVILSLITEVLPDFSPELFPYLERSNWVIRDEYELESIKKYKNEIITVRKRADKELNSINEKIKKDREKFGFIHGILTKTGDDLVKDVIKCLEFIDFKKVIDVDSVIDGSNPKQEDLQIHDKSPVLLVEVKGISGLPDEEEVLQVVKYIPRRMKDWDRRDVNGVSLINHQKHIPALERDNENVFTKQQIEDAESHDITLITTWDLFILIRGMMKYKWDPAVIKDLFYEKGRISNVPSNYKPIGKIFTYIKDENVIGIKITDKKLYIGQRIGYRLNDKFLEEEITSLQINNKDVNEAHSGQSVGIKTIYSKDELKNGIIVYEVLQ